MNCVTIIGRLTSNPKVSHSGEVVVARFNVAIDRKKSKNNPDPGADFPSIVCFGNTAELAERYLTKGRLVGIQGRIQTGSYEKDGRTIYVTDVIADRVEFLDRAGEEELTPSRGAENKSKSLKPGEDDFAQETLTGFSKLSGDDIPFGG